MNMLKEDQQADYLDPLEGDASPTRPLTSKVYGSREVSFGASFSNSRVLEEENLKNSLNQNLNIENPASQSIQDV